MSLINDALKRAKLAQSAPPPETIEDEQVAEEVEEYEYEGETELMPVETVEETPRQPWFVMAAVVGAVGAAAFGGVLLWRGLFGVPPVPKQVTVGHSETGVRTEEPDALNGAATPRAERSAATLAKGPQPIATPTDAVVVVPAVATPVPAAPPAVVVAAPVTPAPRSASPAPSVVAAPAGSVAVGEATGTSGAVARTVPVGTTTGAPRSGGGGVGAASAPVPARPAEVMPFDPTFTKKLQGIFFRLKRPTVVIDGKLLTIDSEIDGWRVEHIDRESVTLSAQGKRHMLRME